MSIIEPCSIIASIIAPDSFAIIQLLQLLHQLLRRLLRLISIIAQFIAIIDQLLHQILHQLLHSIIACNISIVAIFQLLHLVNMAPRATSDQSVRAGRPGIYSEYSPTSQTHIIAKRE